MVLHGILVTNKELKRFKIRNDDIYSQYKSSDFLEHTLLECPTNLTFNQEIHTWFNTLNRANVNLSNEQLLFQNNPSHLLNNNIGHKLDLFVLLVKSTYSAVKLVRLTLAMYNF